MLRFEGLEFHVMVAHLHIGLHRDQDMTETERKPRLAETERRPRLAETKT
jgi:hypothetical protein